jgi:hypothetical protein
VRPHLRLATAADAALVAATMRAEDAAEAMAQGGQGPAEALLGGLLLSQPCLAVIGAAGGPIALLGVIPEHALAGRVWLLGVEGMLADQQNRRAFVRQAPEVIDWMHSVRPILFNVVDARNQVHVRWLRRMGFTMISDQPDWGPEHRLFYEFCRVQDVRHSSSSYCGWSRLRRPWDRPAEIGLPAGTTADELRERAGDPKL